MIPLQRFLFESRVSRARYHSPGCLICVGDLSLKGNACFLDLPAVSIWPVSLEQDLSCFLLKSGGRGRLMHPKGKH